MSFVYLIGENGNEGSYKIGSTRCKDIKKRLKQLQTGNSNSLFIKSSFETDYPFKIEKMLHAKFKNNRSIGEWFYLGKNEVESFNDVCSDFEKSVKLMKDNPFF